MYFIPISLAASAIGIGDYDSIFAAGFGVGFHTAFKMQKTCKNGDYHRLGF